MLDEDENAELREKIAQLVIERDRAKAYCDELEAAIKEWIGGLISAGEKLQDCIKETDNAG
jgi:hypothetical protein